MLTISYREGKIKHIGFSECSSGTLRRGVAVGPVSAVQIEYNPWTLEIETEAGTNLLATCRELGVAVVTFSPLGRGFLTGRLVQRISASVLLGETLTGEWQV
jgi:aryl-alcohol dehydrogenase-like predicted oxidoreductase